MKRIGLIVFACVLLVVLGLFLSKKQSVFFSLIPNTTSATSWNYTKTIATPLKGKSTVSSDVNLGTLEKDTVAITIPKGSYDGDTTITVTNPAIVPAISPHVLHTIGAPIEVLATTKTRLNQKADVTFRFDKTRLLKETRADQLRVAYYDGKNWEYIRPTNVDMSAGTLSFSTYHFSTYGPGSVNDSTIINSWIHTQALGNQLGNAAGKTSDVVAGQIINLTLEKMGVTDPSAANKVREHLMKDENYQRVASTYKNNTEEAAKQIAILVGTKIAEDVPKGLFTDKTLKYSGQGSTDVAAVAQAVGFISEGNYKEAAKVIGDQIADRFVITTAGKIAIVVVQSQIANWKDSEIEAAYQAYKNGANATFYGYNVDKEDFNGVWDQMRGIRRQLEIEALAAENKGREEAGLPPLTEAQQQSLRDRVKQTFQQQFTLRKEKEGELAKEEEKLKAIMASFEKAGFLGISPPNGLNKGYDLENKMDILNHFAQKMMEDTNRFDISDKTGLLVDGKLSLEDLVQGARYYFGAKNDDEGKAAYTKFLTDRFGILPYPPLSKLVGTWKGTMTITDVWVDPALKNDKEALKKEGCDLDIKFEEMLGKTNPVDFTLAATSDTAGTMIFSSGKDAKSMSITYTNGVIGGSYSEQGATVTMSLTATGDKDIYGIKGSLRMNFKDKIKITGTISATKNQ
jgi:hypothetical protein